MVVNYFSDYHLNSANILEGILTRTLELSPRALAEMTHNEVVHKRPVPSLDQCCLPFHLDGRREALAFMRQVPSIILNAKGIRMLLALHFSEELESRALQRFP